MFEYFTLDDFEFKGKIVGIRVDINSPIKNNEIMMNQRIKAATTSIKELQKKGARVVILAHQGREGKDDCLSLSNHQKLLEKILNTTISFEKTLYSKSVEHSIASLSEGEILLLENLRFFDDEKQPDKKDNALKKLERIFDYYVFDAFSVAHRNHASITIFSSIPVIAGRLMEKELKGLSNIEEAKPPHLYSLGGAKPDDLIPLIKKSLERKNVEIVLLSGVIGEIALVAQGYHLGKKQQLLEQWGWLEHKTEIKNLLKHYPNNIILPRDIVSVDEKGKRIVFKKSDLHSSNKELETTTIQDIGPKTISYFNCYIKKAKSVYFKGPPGNFEIKGGDEGTKQLLFAITNSHAYTFMGGGHSVTAADELGHLKNFSYVSLAGGALVKFLEDEPLPAIKILEQSHQKYERMFEDFIVVGSNVLDINVSIPEKLSSVVLGDKIKVEDDFKQSIGGGGVNVSSALSRLGGKVGYLGKISHETADKVEEELQKNGVTLIETKKSRKPAAKSLLLNTQDRDRVIFTYRGQNASLEYEDFDVTTFNAPNYYFTSLTGDAFSTYIKLVGYLKKQNPTVCICFNPSSYLIKNEPKLKKFIQNISIIILNLEEGQELTQKTTVSDVLKEITNLGPKIAIVTAGSNGSFAYDGTKEYRVEAEKVRVVDSTGAGDSYGATFFYYYVKGYGIRKSMKLAAKNAASVVGKKGTLTGLLYKDDIISK